MLWMDPCPIDEAFQANVPPPGLVDVNTSPARSTATQKLMLAQDTPAHRDWRRKARISPGRRPARWMGRRHDATEGAGHTEAGGWTGWSGEVAGGAIGNGPGRRPTRGVGRD